LFNILVAQSHAVAYDIILSQQFVGHFVGHFLKYSGGMMSKLTVKHLQALTEQDVGKRIPDAESLYGTVKARSEGISVLFRWRYRINGLHKDFTCGTWPKVSLAKIRDKRDEAQQLLKEGKDPAIEKRIDRLKSHAEQLEVIDKEKARIGEAEAHKARLDVLRLFARWERLELIRRKDKGAEVKRSFEKDIFPVIGHVAVEDVTRSMVAKLLYDVVERGAPIIARNLLGDMRQMFGFAIKNDWIENDPSSHLKRDDFGRKVERERVLSEAEIKTLRDKLADAHMANQNIATLWIMLSTCCRISEISQARWADIDLGAAKWRIPPENTKNAKEHTVYLSAFTIEHFETLRKLSDGNSWVLPASHKNSHICLKSLAKQIGDRQRGGRLPMKGRSVNTNSLVLPGGKWTPHDLRRTGATMMGALGVRPDVIEKCLNHVEQNKLVRIYQRQKLQMEQAEAWLLLGERLELLLNNPAGNIVLLRKAG
jgi:integrase